LSTIGVDYSISRWTFPLCNLASRKPRWKSLVNSLCNMGTSAISQ
jgi:hypothetical protein